MAIEDNNSDDFVQKFETAEEALEALLGFAEGYPAMKRHIVGITPEEMGSVLFFGTGPELIIQGMHYKDDVLDMKNIPNIFPGAEEGAIIAAFPDSMISEMVEMIAERYDEEYRDAVWQKMLGLMCEAVVDILEGNDIPVFDAEKLLK